MPELKACEYVSHVFAFARGAVHLIYRREREARRYYDPADVIMAPRIPCRATRSRRDKLTFVGKVIVRQSAPGKGGEGGSVEVAREQSVARRRFLPCSVICMIFLFFLLNFNFRQFSK